MTRFLLTAILSLAAAPTLAETVTLTAPGAGATLKEQRIAMTVYYVEAETGYDVTATYLARRDAEPGRMRMTLADGDRVSFGVPGTHGTLFSFARNGGTVSVDSIRTTVDLLSN